MKGDRRLAGWSGCCYLSVCHRARSAVNDQRMEYEEVESFEEYQNESKGMNLKNSNDMKCTRATRAEPKGGSGGVGWNCDTSNPCCYAICYTYCNTIN
jgi:hypothetical protein